MSTKIYTGFRLDDSIDVFEFNRVARKELQKTAEELIAREVIETAAELQDRYWFTGKVPECVQNSVISTAADTILREREQHPSSSVVHDPYSVELSIGQDSVTGLVVGILHAQVSDYLDTLLEIPGVHEYTYWDNTDRPDGSTEQEWQERKQVWSRVCPMAPVNTMLTIRLHPRGTDSMVQSFAEDAGAYEIAQFAPSREWRAAHVARELVTRAFVDSNEGGRPPVQECFELIQWLYANSEHPAHQQLHTNIMATLSVKLTETLTGPFVRPGEDLAMESRRAELIDAVLDVYKSTSWT